MSHEAVSRAVESAARSPHTSPWPSPQGGHHKTRSLGYARRTRRTSMSVRFDHKAPWHPKVIGLTDRAFRAWIKAICYCDQHLTNGTLDAVQWRILGATKRALEELRVAGLVEEDLSLHDYLTYQDSRDQALLRRGRGAERQRRLRVRRNAVTDGVSNGVRNAGSNAPHLHLPSSRAIKLPPKAPQGRHAWDPAGSEELRCEDLMVRLDLNGATRGRLRAAGLSARQLYVILRDALDSAPKRPGGWVWSLVQKELGDGIGDGS